MENKMDIVVISSFCGDFKNTGNSRFLYLVNLLKRNHSVEVITSDFNHGSKSHFGNVPEGDNYQITMLHEFGYPKNVCIKRLVSHYMWGKRVKSYLENRKRPDVIYCAVPTLTAAAAAAKYCKENNIRFIIDIQDLWPEAFQMVFNIPFISSILFKPMQNMADYIYETTDEIIAVSDTYVKRAAKVNKKNSNNFCAFLGTELSYFDKCNKENEVVYADNITRVAYIGTLGHSYDLKCVMDALEILKKQGKDNIRFIVMGDGPLRKSFENYAMEKQIDCEFKGALHYDKMVGELCACDIAVNPIVGGAAQSIINKHADYAASGLPVVNTQECEEYRELIDQYKCGFNCSNGDAEDLASKMFILIEDEKLRNQMGENSRRLAEEKFDRGKTYGEIVDIIEGNI